MYSRQFRLRQFLLIPVVATIFFVGCDKDDDIDLNSPAGKIAESEKLVIPAAVEIPANVPGGNSRVATYYALGVQKYKSQLKAGTTNTFEWVFVAPQADLYDATNNKIGTHTAGPTWQLIGSTTDSIYAQQFTPVRSASSPDAGSIDWLLLMPKAGKTPTGIFANVSYIQRIATVGGKAPATPPLTAGETHDVSYTAIYRFTRKNP